MLHRPLIVHSCAFDVETVIVPARKLALQGDCPNHVFATNVKNLGVSNVSIKGQYSSDGTSWSDVAAGAATVKAQASKLYEFCVPVQGGGTTYWKVVGTAADSGQAAELIIEFVADDLSTSNI